LPMAGIFVPDDEGCLLGAIPRRAWGDRDVFRNEPAW
jgi:hypothetical protein